MRKETDLEEVKQRVVDFGDELEDDCWSLVKNYCADLGITILPDEYGNIPISFDIAKNIQDTILGHLEDAGVKFDFDGEFCETEEISL